VPSSKAVGRVTHYQAGVTSLKKRPGSSPTELVNVNNRLLVSAETSKALLQFAETLGDLQSRL
jgi:hypothetical protein